MGNKYKSYWYGGIEFLFAYDEIDPTLLHIYARHLTTPLIAMRTWWEGEIEYWNEERKRYQTSDDQYTVYWFWLKPDKTVLVITCFGRQNFYGSR